MLASRSKTGRLNLRDGIWLCFAIAVHALLFFIPIKREPMVTAGQNTVAVTLTMFEPGEKSLYEPAEPAPPESPPLLENASLPEAEELALAKLPQPEVPAQAEINEATESSPELLLSTARLMDSFSDIEWPALHAKRTRQLGVSMPQPGAANRGAGLGIDENIFNGMVVPRKTEIVDRWLAPDGSQNVVINTANGDTYCGRGQAWDPMRPLIENVIQYRPCGGGGKRSFEMPTRRPYWHDRTDVANSTTN